MLLKLKNIRLLCFVVQKEKKNEEKKSGIERESEWKNKRIINKHINIIQTKFI